MSDLKARGVGRIADDGSKFFRQVLDVHFNREPTDDELRAFHNHVTGWAELRAQLTASQAQIATVQADNVRLREALNKIQHRPAIPLPDPQAHSWESYGRRAGGALVDIHFISHEVLAIPSDTSALDEMLMKAITECVLQLLDTPADEDFIEAIISQVKGDA